MHKYMHLLGCQGTSIASDPLTTLFEHPPKKFKGAYCTGCKQYCPPSQFTWEDGTTVGT